MLHGHEDIVSIMPLIDERKSSERTSREEDDRSLIREDKSEFVFVRITLSFNSGFFTVELVLLLLLLLLLLFSTHTPRLLDAAIKSRKTPRTPEQNLTQRDRRWLKMVWIFSERSTVSYITPNRRENLEERAVSVAANGRVDAIRGWDEPNHHRFGEFGEGLIGKEGLLADRETQSVGRTAHERNGRGFSRREGGEGGGYKAAFFSFSRRASSIFCRSADELNRVHSPRSC